MNVRLILTGILLLAVTIFAAQNTEIVEVEFLFWGLRLPRSILIFLLLAAGIVAGWILRSTVRFSKRR